MAPKVKLTYFNLRGRAEPARLLLAYGGVEYEDHRLKDGEWAGLKPQTPYGSVPVLEWDGCTVAQSVSIARFIAKEVGLGGRTNLEAAQADEIVDAINDLLEGVVNTHFKGSDEAAKKKFLSETLPNGFAKMEARLCNRGGQYFAGNALTWADVLAFNFCSWLPDVAPGAQSCLDQCPKMKNLLARVGEIPNIKAWLERRPVSKM